MLFVMDPIESINIKKDTTFVIMLEAQKRGHEISYCELKDLFINDARGHAKSTSVKLKQAGDYHKPGKTAIYDLDHFDVVWMRKDPPFNMDYIYATYILNLVNSSETKVINSPKGIRESNEKIYSLHFNDFIPETLVSKNINQIKEFMDKTGGEIVVKPLDGYGGEGIFYIKEADFNTNAILESITNFGSTYIMAQKFIKKVSEGDKRIIMLNGDPIGAVLRVAAKGEFRSNFHSGGHPVKTELTKRDMDICNAVGPRLIQDKLYFVGIDVVGGYLTEVNTTSPTCVQEINHFSKTKLEEQIVDFAEGLCTV
ncbi:MAG: glutathione synthase [Thermodesulfobacteriota bacterium]